MDFLKRKFTVGEEIFSAISHGTGALLSIAGCVVLIVFCAVYADARSVASAAVYGSSLIIFYTMSALYHAITNEKAKKVFQVLDINTVPLFIAGTYTPYALVSLRGSLGWIIFGAIWALAVVGIIFSLVSSNKFRNVAVAFYMLMGWAIIIAIKPLQSSMPKISLVFLILGGAFYSVGVIFCALRELKYMHSVWHLFVISGSIFHYFSIFFAMVKI